MAIRQSLAVRTLPLIALLSSVASAADLQEEIVAFTTHDDLEIECILSYPGQGTGPFPGMLMIASSGLHDADVTLNEPTLQITDGEQTLFRPLARYFSRQGWAVQRCNKRGASFRHAADQPGILERATLDDLVEDARNALETLHDHRRVVASPLVVLGHSEGTQVATRLARNSPEIDLLVLVGSVARRFDALIEYQLVDRNLTFLRQAADADGDDNLTLKELDALDGNFGLGSVYVWNSAEILFSSSHSPTGELQVTGFNGDTDVDGDGQLHISREIEPALRRAVDRFLELAAEGSLGEYWRSMVEAKSPRSQIHRVGPPILFVHGGLDVQTPIDEALSLMAALESRGGADYDILIFPELGHSLSKPNDFFDGDGGLTVLDNLTLNAPRLKTRRKLLQRIEANLPR